jgi:hypothetical protein
MLKLKIGIKLSGVFDSEFWDQLVLQASFDEPAILHAVAAIGSAFRSKRLAGQPTGTSPTRLDIDEEGSQALLEYTKAIRCLQYHLRHNDIWSLRVTLITCMLFICFEYLRRNLQTGDTHLRNGLRILRQIQAGRLSQKQLIPSVEVPPDSVDEYLSEAFSRLNLQCTLFGLGSQYIHTHVPTLTCDSTGTFESPAQARRHLDALLGGTYRQLLEYCQNIDNKQETSDLALFLQHQQRLKTQLNRWQQKLMKTLEQPSSGIKTTISYRVLWMYHTMAQVIASVSHPQSLETDFDNYTDDFRNILAHSKVLTQMEKEYRLQLSPGSNQRKSFTVDMGYIPVLYYTGLKCRVPAIRREAARMMYHSPHCEGVWDGEYTAAIVRRVIAIEEGGSYEDTRVDGRSFDQSKAGTASADDQPTVSEESRIRQLNVVLPAEGLAQTKLQCLRRTWIEGSGWSHKIEIHDLWHCP